MIPYIDPWKPYPLTVTRHDSTDADTASKVIAQFHVETNPRYTPRDLNKDGVRDTFCNIFLWDYSRAMGAEIPHWVLANGASAAVGMGRELDANGVVEWMRAHGPTAGWRKIVETEAREMAAQGYPTVVLWNHHGGIGHVAVVRPGPNDVTLIAQAGSHNYETALISKGFGLLKEPALEFWTHE